MDKFEFNQLRSKLALSDKEPAENYRILWQLIKEDKLSMNQFKILFVESFSKGK